MKAWHIILVTLGALGVTALVLGVVLLHNFSVKKLVSPMFPKTEDLTRRQLFVDLANNPPPGVASTSGQAASPSATPKPLTFAEMNTLYGPCTVLPTLMFHHIQPEADAKAQGHAYLDVDPAFFQRDMQFLKDHSYSVVGPDALISFFDGGTPLPHKSIILTFDDGYDDYNTYAVPILNAFNFKATLFVPTGLINNPGYLSWGTIMGIANNSNFYMANHTWSHHNMAANHTVVDTEIGTADQQLSARGLDLLKVFAYPYGTTGPYAIAHLSQLGYKLAFTTVHGSTLCKQQRLTLPRIRIGNAPLSSYGL
jgi:peptidoglycan/xylan/chitin deacetylase (PgdA/CDA1 family)